MVVVPLQHVVCRGRSAGHGLIHSVDSSCSCAMSSSHLGSFTPTVSRVQTGLLETPEYMSARATSQRTAVDGRVRFAGEPPGDMAAPSDDFGELDRDEGTLPLLYEWYCVTYIGVSVVTADQWSTTRT